MAGALRPRRCHSRHKFRVIPGLTVRRTVRGRETIFRRWFLDRLRVIPGRAIRRIVRGRETIFRRWFLDPGLCHSRPRDPKDVRGKGNHLPPPVPGPPPEARSASLAGGDTGARVIPGRALRRSVRGRETIFPAVSWTPFPRLAPRARAGGDTGWRREVRVIPGLTIRRIVRGRETIFRHRFLDPLPEARFASLAGGDTGGAGKGVSFPAERSEGS